MRGRGVAVHMSTCVIQEVSAIAVRFMLVTLPEFWQMILSGIGPYVGKRARSERRWGTALEKEGRSRPETNRDLASRLQESATRFRNVAGRSDADAEAWSAAAEAVDSLSQHLLKDPDGTPPDTPARLALPPIGKPPPAYSPPTFRPKASWLGETPDRMRFDWADGEPRKWTLFDKRNPEHSDWAQAVANLLEGGANGLWEETSGRLAFCPAPFFSDVQFAHLEINLDDRCLTALFSLVKSPFGNHG